MSIQKVSYKELKNQYLPLDLDFNTTDDLEGLDIIIGQQAASRALEFGLSMESQGYNIYVSGDSSKVCESFTKKIINNKSRDKNLQDWCYVYNFRDEKSPIAIAFKQGEGINFKNDIKELNIYIQEEIPRIYKREKEREKKILDEIYSIARKMGFLLKIENDMVSIFPLKEDNSIMLDDEYNELSILQKEEIDVKSKELQKMIKNKILELRQLKGDSSTSILNISQDIIIRKIGYYIKKLKEKYITNKKVLCYLTDMQEDLINNISNITNINTMQNNILERYMVNLIIDNGITSNLPIISAEKITKEALIGYIQYNNTQGSLVTNHMNINPGLIHKANGGYLILDAEEIVKDISLWELIKEIIKTNKISIKSPGFESLISIEKLYPEYIPVESKIILTGSRALYYFLYNQDRQFKDLFKVYCEISKDIDNNKENITLFLKNIKSICDKENLRPFSYNAVEKIMENIIRQKEDKDKLSTDFEYVEDILKECNYFASQNNSQIVDTEHVILAIKNRIEREGMHGIHLRDEINKNTILIDTKGHKIGQINALAVNKIANYRFGIPIKLTCTTYKGVPGVINIEKEVGLSGKISQKGNQIIMGYLGQQFAQNMRVNFVARICYEQSYRKIDGDSASSTELYSIISSLAQVPINQELAVTGSVNQYGDIQPVGSITQKVEGFYDICKSRGLTGSQGVIIPKQNIRNLILKESLIKDMENDKFHIYAISNIQDGIELLTGLNYNVVFTKVRNKIIQFNNTK